MRTNLRGLTIGFKKRYGRFTEGLHAWKSSLYQGRNSRAVILVGRNDCQGGDQTKACSLDLNEEQAKRLRDWLDLFLLECDAEANNGNG